jgi:hypothetical protein
MKKFMITVVAVLSMSAGVWAEDIVLPLFQNGKPLAGFSAAADGGICLNASYKQWGGATVPLTRGAGKYTVTMEILAAEGEQAAAVFYFIMADGKHKQVSPALKGGKTARKHKIVFNAPTGVKGFMLKKSDKTAAPTLAFKDLRINYVSSELPAADAVKGKVFAYPLSERRSKIACTVDFEGKKGTAIPAANGQYSWNTIQLGKEFPAGKYQLKLDVIASVDNPAAAAFYLAGGKTAGQKWLKGFGAKKAGVQSVTFVFTAQKSFTELILKKMSKGQVESVGVGDFTITVL